MKKSLLFFSVAVLMTVLSACAGGGGGYGGIPWPSGNSGVVTNDPNSIPDIAWQTNRQRDELISQNNSLKNAQQRPSLQTVVGAPPQINRKATVSILLPLSGAKADLGQSMLKAAQMALFDVGSANFELVPRDTKSTAAGAEAAARAAANAGNQLILGPVFADDVKAVKPVAASAGIPVVAFTTDWALADSNTYIMGFLPFIQVARVTAYAQSKGLDRFAAFAPQTDYADVVISTLQRSASGNVKVGRYAPQQSDLSDIVKDFVETSKEGNGLAFDALMLPVGGESLKSLVSVFDLHGVTAGTTRFIGTGLWDDPALSSDPALFGSWFAAPDPALRRDFERRYQDNYGSAPLRLASLAYDATALAAVLSRTSTDDDIYSRRQMTNPRGFAGIDGIFRFRGDGLAERGLAVLELRSGSARVIDPAPTAFISGS